MCCLPAGRSARPTCHGCRCLPRANGPPGSSSSRAARHGARWACRDKVPFASGCWLVRDPATRISNHAQLLCIPCVWVIATLGSVSVDKVHMPFCHQCCCCCRCRFCIAMQATQRPCWVLARRGCTPLHTTRAPLAGTRCCWLCCAAPACGVCTERQLLLRRCGVIQQPLC